MDTTRKYENAKKRIELMLEEIKLLGIDAEEIVDETQAFHRANFSSFDILDRDQVLAERAALDKVSDATLLRGAISQLRSNLESEFRKLGRNAFQRAL